MKALSEIISFCDGRGPSEHMHTNKRIISFLMRDSDQLKSE